MWMMRSQLHTSVIDPFHHSSPKPKPNIPYISLRLVGQPTTLRFPITISCSQNPTLSSSDGERPKLTPNLLQTLTASAILFIGIGIRACLAATPTPPVANSHTLVDHHSIQDNEDMKESDNVDNYEDKEVRASFESWKSKTYALTVPLRIVALRNSIPPSWIKSFLQSQGRRVKFRLEFRGNLEDIFSEVSMAFSGGNVTAKSAAAADVISLGDTWFSSAISKKLIEPIHEVEDQEWFRGLSDKWKVYLRRNSEGKLDSEGGVWAAPYRWGSMVIAYRKSKFRKHKLVPLEDWADLWRPDLAGKISMVDSPREVVGAVLKYMGASYNTSNIDSEVAGGRNAVRDKLEALQKQVRLFDSSNYLKAFGIGDVWVAVGWSSDIIPAAKRMSDVVVIVPKSGASLWADLWAIPAASNIATDKLGGRVRGPSPLLHQWIEFCMQAERALPFEEEVIPGASPFALERAPLKKSEYLSKNKPKLDTNLIAGIPPSDILSRCEFLEPLSDSALLDYQWLIASMQKPNHGLIQKMQHYMSLAIQTFRFKLDS